MNIALIGYGKMGKAIEEIALERGHQVPLKIDDHNGSDLNPENLANIDVAIEFTTPESAFDNINSCFNSNTPVVSGTTGWLDKMDSVKERCEREGQTFFYASNFSVGVNIFFEINRRLAELMNNYKEYDVSIEEIHHIHKKDAPSGTAATMAEDIIGNLDRKSKWVLAPSLEINELQIASLRTGMVPGTHITRYFSEIDNIEIKHTANGRKGFALGAVLAAEWLKGKKGVFGMKDLIGH